MGNVLKTVATGGLSLLPGKAGDIAGSVATGVPFGWSNNRRRPTAPPVPGIAEGAATAPEASGLSKAMGIGPGLVTNQGMMEGPARAAGLISRLVNPSVQGAVPGYEQPAPQISPRERVKARRAELAARGNRAVPAQRANPVEATGRQFVTNQRQG